MKGTLPLFLLTITADAVVTIVGCCRYCCYVADVGGGTAVAVAVIATVDDAVITLVNHLKNENKKHVDHRPERRRTTTH